MSDSHKVKTDAELRKFGFVVGGVFLALAALALWRGKFLGPYLLVLGLVLVLPAAVVPRILAPVEKYWMKFAEVLGGFMTRVILTIVFVLVVTPLGLLARFVGRDVLKLKLDRNAKTYWEPVESDGPASRPFLPY